MEKICGRGGASIPLLCLVENGRIAGQSRREVIDSCAFLLELSLLLYFSFSFSFVGEAGAENARSGPSQPTARRIKRKEKNVYQKKIGPNERAPECIGHERNSNQLTQWPFRFTLIIKGVPLLLWFLLFLFFFRFLLLLLLLRLLSYRDCCCLLGYGL